MMKKSLLALLFVCTALGHAFAATGGGKDPAAVRRMLEVVFHPSLSVPLRDAALPIYRRVVGAALAETMAAKQTTTRQPMRKTPPVVTRIDYRSDNLLFRQMEKTTRKYNQLPTATSPGLIRNNVLMYYTFLLKDITGTLNPADSVQLKRLFWSTNPSIEAVEERLIEWLDKYHYPPTLPTKADLSYWEMTYQPPYEEMVEEAPLASDIYWLQRVYGKALPERLQSINVIPSSIKDSEEELIEKTYVMLAIISRDYLPASMEYLADAIQRRIEGQIPLQKYENGRYKLLNPQTTHFILLDVLLTDTYTQDEVTVTHWLSAFENLCAETEPTLKNIAHFKVLQQGLQRACLPALSKPLEEEGQVNIRQQEIREKADRLLWGPVENLLGTNL